jgi:hypothetical protein
MTCTHKCQWLDLMVVGRTPAEMWQDVRKIDPNELIALTVYALKRASDMLADGDNHLVTRRRALLVAQMCAHRVSFDLMGLEPSPDADTLGPVSTIFFT